MTGLKEAFQKHYKEHALSYDSLRDEKNPTTRANAAAQVRYVLSRFKEADQVVEVGCGTGKFTLPLARSGKKVTAIDFSEKMLEVLEKKAAAEGLCDRITFRHGDIENLDLRSGSAQAVLSIAVIRHFEDDRRALGELARVLAPSGVLVCDYLDRGFFRPYEFIKKIAGRGKNMEKGKEWFRNFYRSGREMRAKLKAAGLTVIHRKGFLLLPEEWTERLGLHGPVRFLEDLTGLGAVVLLTSRKTG